MAPSLPVLQRLFPHRQFYIQLSAGQLLLGVVCSTLVFWACQASTLPLSSIPSPCFLGEQGFMELGWPWIHNHPVFYTAMPWLWILFMNYSVQSSLLIPSHPLKAPISVNGDGEECVFERENVHESVEMFRPNFSSFPEHTVCWIPWP